MMNAKTSNFQWFPLCRNFILALFLSSICLNLWASQDAMVIVEKALVYSDVEMTSPVGYIRRGKKIKVGEIPRNKAQAYPIVVSGRVAYIRVLDVTTEKESMDSQRLVAERFQKNTEKKYSTKYVLSYYSFASTIALEKENGEVMDGDALNWNGASLKGEALVVDNWDFQVLANYMTTTKGEETFKVFEFGFGGAYRLINARYFLLRLEGQLLAIPFSSYALGSKFRVNSFGASAGGGLNSTILLGKHWGLEGFAGYYYTKTFNYKTPDPYEQISPSFAGARIGLGINYTY